MVKVQKRTPKTLSNVGKVENIIKKKNNKTKIAAVAITDAAAPAKLKKTVKNAEVAPIKNKKVVNAVKKQEITKLAATPLAAVPPKQLNNKVAKKRPAVLAPPQSPSPIPIPSPVAPASEAVKLHNKKAKNAVSTTAAAAAPVVAKKVQQTAEPNKKVGPKPQLTQELTKAQKKKAAIKAFKKQQLEKKKSVKHTKKPVEREHIYEPLPFDEHKLNAILSIPNVKKLATALHTVVEEEMAKKKTAIFSDYRFMLNVACFKIPSCPKRVVRLGLKHSLVDKDNDVVIIVPDLQRGRKVDYEPTIQHYEDMFREAGIKGLKIMPFNQLKTEYNTYEALRKFANTYDYYLCDGRLIGQVSAFCGTFFQNPNTTFHGVRLDNKKYIGSVVKRAMSRTAYRQLQRGDLISIPVGTHMYSMQQVAENVDHVVGQLKTLYAGGLANVRAMYLRIDIKGTTAIPLYINLGQAPPETPYVVGKREQRMLKLKKEANEVLSKFAMTKDAKLVKLTNEQVENKRKIKEARAAIAASTSETLNDSDGEESAVPAKKSKTEEKAEVVDKDSKKKSADEQPEPEGDSDEDDESGTDEGDDDVAEDGDDDEDDDEDEGNSEVDGDDDDEDNDDDDDDDDDDDEEGDDDEDEDEAEGSD